jgi:uncharacterized protein YggU (UPF0235/DUF167 family)
LTGALPWRDRGDHLAVAVRLTPKGGRDGIDGIAMLADGRAVLAVRVRAAPEAGAANAALCALLAAAAGVPPTAVTVVAGATARLKQVRIAAPPGPAAAALAAQVEARADPARHLAKHLAKHPARRAETGRLR